jgi:hypothetical protein
MRKLINFWFFSNFILFIQYLSLHL